VTHIRDAEDANRSNKRYGPHKEISYLSQGRTIIDIINNAQTSSLGKKDNVKKLSYTLFSDNRKGIALLEGSLSSPACPSDSSSMMMMMMMMSTEFWWNDSDREKLKYSDRN